MSKEFLSNLVHYRTYAKYLPEKQRRENKQETIARNIQMHVDKFPHLENEIRQAYQSVYAGRVVPSMRSFQFAGEPIVRRNQRSFNCAFTHIKKFKDFADLFYMSMSGCGVGYSVQKQHISQLPVIKEGEVEQPFIIEDSAEGWADSIIALLENPDRQFDYTRIRKAGEPLSTGGHASGPKALISMHAHVRAVLRNAVGRKLTPFECHRICCLIADCVVVGGVRRCLPAGTKVFTTKGIKKIEELNLKDLVFDKDGNPQRVLATQCTGELPLIEIQHKLGKIYCTPEHRLGVLKDLDGEVEWKEAQNLTCDDNLVINNMLIEEGEDLQYPPFNFKKKRHDTKSEEIKIPQFDSGQAWLLGNLHGDGYVYITDKKSCRDYIMFACAPDMPKTVKKIVKEIERFGVTPSIKTSIHDNCIRVRKTCKPLAQFFSQFKKPNTEIEIPELVWRGNSTIRAAYLAGLFDADGSAKSSRNKVINPKIVTTVYKKYAEDIVVLLSSLGIAAQVKETDRSHIENWKNIYTVYCDGSESIQRLKGVLDLFSEKSRNDFNTVTRKTEQCSFVVPKKLSRISSIFKQAIKYHTTNNGKNKVLCSWKKFQSAVKLDYTYKPVKILSVKGTERVEPVFDIEVENTNNFLIEQGIVSHNSALISMFDYDNEEMLNCKAGNWWEKYPELARANNSAVVLKDDPDFEKKAEKVIQACFDGGQAEPGLLLSNNLEYGTNPCAEIALSDPCGTCNLTEINAASCLSKEDWLRAVEDAAIIGTLQATYTDFKYVHPDWKKSAEEDALLGVSITGQAENQAILTEENLQEGAKLAVEVNKEWAKKLKINSAKRVTCVKPSGTSSSWLETTAGIHAGHNRKYLRRVRMEKDSALGRALQKYFPPFVAVDPFNDSNIIVEIPIRLRPDTLLRSNETAIQCLERMKKVYKNWVKLGHIEGPNTHNISLTINYHEHEKEAIKKWMIENKDHYYGISLIPYDGGDYQYLPYSQDMHEEFFRVIEKAFAKCGEGFDFDAVREKKDYTDFKGEAACAGGTCTIEL